MSAKIQALCFHVKWLLVFDLGLEPLSCLDATTDEGKEQHLVRKALSYLLPSLLHVKMIWVASYDRLFAEAPKNVCDLVSLFMELIDCMRTDILFGRAHADVTLGRFIAICVRCLIKKVAIHRNNESKTFEDLLGHKLYLCLLANEPLGALELLDRPKCH